MTIENRKYQHAGRPVLTGRQLQMLLMVSDGMTDSEIAGVAFISETTAKRHVRDILSKMNARNRAHAVHLAHQRGIIS